MTPVPSGGLGLFAADYAMLVSLMVSADRMIRLILFADSWRLVFLFYALAISILSQCLRSYRSIVSFIDVPTR